jgi:N-acetylglucosaminyl-diphospho-decaprenol L-rhamnosyltransferase
MLTLLPLNYNGRALLERCLPTWKSAAQACSRKVSICIVDNASRDDSKAWCQNNHPEVAWYGLNKNIILTAYNEAIAACTTPYVMILNNDVQLDEHCLDPLLERLESQPRALGVMPRIRADLPEESVNERLNGRFFHGHLGHVPIGPEAGGTLYLHGAAMIVRRDIFLKLGGFDPLFFYQEDNDLSYRAWRAGYTCWFEPRAEVYHLGSQTTNREVRKWIDRRAIKEKANHLFVLKNIQNLSYLANFWSWSFLKILKMIFSIDVQRAWAWKETFRVRALIWRARQKQIIMDDQQVFHRVQDCR